MTRMKRQSKEFVRVEKEATAFLESKTMGLLQKKIS